MPNGKHGDHPLTDIFHWKIEVYSKEADELIRKIKSLSSDRELDQWWDKEIGWNCDPKTALQKAKDQYAKLMQRAKESGWETEK
jgi:hypothetical protein